VVTQGGYTREKLRERSNKSACGGKGGYTRWLHNVVTQGGYTREKLRERSN
jgi:hypothetical protein